MRVRRVRLQGQPLVSGEARWAGGDAAMPAWGPAHNFQHLLASTTLPQCHCYQGMPHTQQLMH